MAEAELNVEELSTSELIAVAAGIAAALKGNANFSNPRPTPMEIDSLTEELVNADTVYDEHLRRVADARVVRNEVARRLRDAVSRVVQYVQEASEGDAAKILSANLHVQETKHLWPFSGAGQVDEVLASQGDLPGEIDLAWDAVPGAIGYEVETAMDFEGQNWEQAGATANSRITMEELEMGMRYWFRVRAVGKRGAGAWSKPVMKFTRGSGYDD